MNRVLHVFRNADLRSGHHGLSALAAGAKRYTSDLKEGEFLVFINRRADKIKVYAANETVAYHRSTTGRIEMTALQHIPKVFSGGKFNFDEATRKALENILRH